jgi:hypothetical protein
VSIHDGTERDFAALVDQLVAHVNASGAEIRTPARSRAGPRPILWGRSDLTEDELEQLDAMRDVGAITGWE